MTNQVMAKPTVFFGDDRSHGFAPIICYESVYGEYVTEYVRQGAKILVIITNDGWWGDTPGYIQHNSFSALRAIENRRSVARSANTGISSFFNQKGEMLKMLGWWERAAIKETLNANDELTFYTRHGDYFGRVSTFAGIALLLVAGVDDRPDGERKRSIHR